MYLNFVNKYFQPIAQNAANKDIAVIFNTKTIEKF